MIINFKRDRSCVNKQEHINNDTTKVRNLILNTQTANDLHLLVSSELGTHKCNTQERYSLMSVARVKKSLKFYVNLEGTDENITRHN